MRLQSALTALAAVCIATAGHEMHPQDALPFVESIETDYYYRSRAHLILAGPYGHVYARISYFYAPEYAGQPNTIEVAGYTRC